MKETEPVKEELIIFDTTLRDGEQSPGASMNPTEKLRIARKLETLGVNVIEAGFPAASEGDFEAVKLIAENLQTAQVAALCRANEGDIKKGWEAIKNAAHPRIHTFIATSELHMKYKLQKDKETVLKEAVEAVKFARTFTDNVEFSAEDGSRSKPEFLCKVFEAVIDAGATTINLPDTVGYAIPEEFGKLVEYVMKNTKNIDKAVLSVHCHNDLGLATSNTISAVNAGARQVELTINGIGERAGNTSLEEVVMAIKTRPQSFPVQTTIDTTKLDPISKLVSMVTGILVQPNKAIVGANAFAHEAGIHQDGVLKNPMTYEIMKPEAVGCNKTSLVLGKHSGRHALKAHLITLGYDLDNEALNKVFADFKKLADKKKTITNEDIEALLSGEQAEVEEYYHLDYAHIVSGTTVYPAATIGIKVEGQTIRNTYEGTGPIDAVFITIKHITKTSPELLRYSVGSITEGTDAQATVTVRLKEGDIVALGRGVDPDTNVASAKAFVNGLNRLRAQKKDPKPIGTTPAETQMRTEKTA